MNDRITHDPHNDGIDRRGMLKCMAWVGTGVAWTLTGGVLTSRLLGARPPRPPPSKGDFTFVQISDSHIGFAKEPNKDVIGTLKIAVDKINALPDRPGLPAAHRRPDAPLQAGGVRHRRRDPQGGQGRPAFLRPRRTRRFR